MKAAVITFPGSNCDDDCRYVLARLSGAEVQSLWHKDAADLSSYDLVVLPGGFSYGDYLRCGAMASLSPIVEQVKAFAAKGGFVLGICNGFQILCESGLLPGALARNEGLRFVCKDVFLKTENTSTPWTSALKSGEVLRVPIAHGDGRYVIDETQLAEIERGGQILFRYCDPSGKHTTGANPNGSTASIAGVCNAEKNVFGLMPHPERATDLRSGHGAGIWKSIETGIRERKLMR